MLHQLLQTTCHAHIRDVIYDFEEVRFITRPVHERQAMCGKFSGNRIWKRNLSEENQFVLSKRFPLAQKGFGKRSGRLQPCIYEYNFGWVWMSSKVCVDIAFPSTVNCDLIILW